MFVEERQNIIVSQVNKNGRVKVKELSEQFRVTEDCIRKDLASLEKRGLLKRAYGGAVQNRVNVHNFEVAQRKDKNIKAKQSIAKKAMNLIQDGDMLFLDITTANIELAKLLLQQNLNVTVVTNMLEVMQILSAPSQIKLIFIGGVYNRKNEGCCGSLTIELISRFRCDLAFLGVVGIDVHENSVSTYDLEDGTTKREVVDRSKKAYLMTEVEKFNQDGNYKYAGFNDFSGIIVDQAVEPDLEDILKQYNIEII